MSRFGYRTRLGLIYDDILTSSLDVDALSFITNAGITDLIQQFSINDLVIGLKTDGIWSKLKAIYPFVGGTASTHKFNLKNPLDSDNAFRLVFTGGWVHDSNGAKPNGTNGYADTKFNPTTQALSTSSQHLSYYSRTNINENAVEIGVISGANNNFLGLYVTSTLGTRSSLASSARYNNTSAPIDTRGFFTASRINATTIKVYVNNAIQASQSISSTANDNFNMYLGTYGVAAGQTLWSTKQVALASIGDGLTDTEAANYYTRVQNFQTALGRQV